MQSYAIKLKNALLGLSFYIFLHILQPYNFPHAATNSSTTLQTQKSRPRDSLESPSREYLVFIFRGLNIHFRPPGV